MKHSNRLPVKPSPGSRSTTSGRTRWARLAHACHFLEDRERAAVLYERLEPWAHRNLVAPIEASLGSAAWPLGRLAATLGEVEAGRGVVRARGRRERASGRAALGSACPPRPRAPPGRARATTHPPSRFWRRRRTHIARSAWTPGSRAATSRPRPRNAFTPRLPHGRILEAMPRSDETFIVRVRVREDDAVVEQPRLSRRRRVRDVSEVGAQIARWLAPPPTRPDDQSGPPAKEELT